MIGSKLNVSDIAMVVINPTIVAIKLVVTMLATNTSKGTGIIACLMLSRSLGSLGYKNPM
jgi:hypothetical protein